MKNYYVTAEVTISIYTKVKAESKEEAERIAGDREEIAKSEWGQSYLADEYWLADDYDGVPLNIKAEEEES